MTTSYNVGAMLKARAAEHPDRVALIMADRRDRSGPRWTKLTYAQFDRLSDREFVSHVSTCIIGWRLITQSSARRYRFRFGLACCLNAEKTCSIFDEKFDIRDMRWPRSSAG